MGFEPEGHEPCQLLHLIWLYLGNGPGRQFSKRFICPFLELTLKFFYFIQKHFILLLQLNIFLFMIAKIINLGLYRFYLCSILALFVKRLPSHLKFILLWCWSCDIVDWRDWLTGLQLWFQILYLFIFLLYLSQCVLKGFHILFIMLDCSLGLWCALFYSFALVLELSYLSC